MSIIQVPHTKKQRKRRFLKIIDLGHTVVLFRGSEGGFVFVNNANMYTCHTDIDKHLRKLPCRLWSYLPMSEWLLTIFMSISRDGKRHHKCCSNGPFCMYNEENVYFSPQKNIFSRPLFDLGVFSPSPQEVNTGLGAIISNLIFLTETPPCGTTVPARHYDKSPKNRSPNGPPPPPLWFYIFKETIFHQVLPKWSWTKEKVKVSPVFAPGFAEGRVRYWSPKGKGGA